MCITQGSDISSVGKSDFEKLVDGQADGHRRLEEAYAEARVMNERGEDGNAHYERIKAEVFAGVSKMFD
ncbi:MAG: hypothetical protein Q7R81_03410 [Candidatus Peregrinibacteria bacterium]|nr:hypothetical protein [Candidatus Peregrinibacteria bacterium]